MGTIQKQIDSFSEQWQTWVSLEVINGALVWSCRGASFKGAVKDREACKFCIRRFIEKIESDAYQIVSRVLPICNRTICKQTIHSGPVWFQIFFKSPYHIKKILLFYSIK